MNAYINYLKQIIAELESKGLALELDLDSELGVITATETLSGIFYINSILQIGSGVAPYSIYKTNGLKTYLTLSQPSSTLDLDTQKEVKPVKLSRTVYNSSKIGVEPFTDEPDEDFEDYEDVEYESDPAYEDIDTYEEPEEFDDYEGEYEDDPAYTDTYEGSDLEGEDEDEYEEEYEDDPAYVVSESDVSNEDEDYEEDDIEYESDPAYNDSTFVEDEGYTDEDEDEDYEYEDVDIEGDLNDEDEDEDEDEYEDVEYEDLDADDSESDEDTYEEEDEEYEYEDLDVIEEIEPYTPSFDNLAKQTSKGKTSEVQARNNINETPNSGVAKDQMMADNLSKAFSLGASLFKKYKNRK